MTVREPRIQGEGMGKHFLILGCFLLTGLTIPGCALDEDEGAQVLQGGVVTGNAGPAQTGITSTG